MQLLRTEIQNWEEGSFVNDIIFLFCELILQ